MRPSKNPIRKILCISVMQNWGGGEEFLLNLCKYINEYKFVIASPEGKALDKYIEKGINVIRNNSLKKIYRGPSGWNIVSFLKILFNIKISTVKLLRTIGMKNPSLVLANGLFAALYVLPSIIISRRKLIVVQHLIFNDTSFEKRIINLIYKYTARIVCVSNAVKENILYMLNKNNSEKIIVISNGISLPGKETLVNKTDTIIKIGIVGSLIRIKGIHLVIEALSDILKTCNVSLHIFGTNVNEEDSLKYETEIRTLIKDLGIEDKICFEGYCESKKKIYSSVDIVINYSLIPESFSLVVLEAMAYKKIVIAANSGGPKEIISDGINGYLVKPGNVGLLKEKLDYCLTNYSSEEMNMIRENARRTVEEKFSMEEFVRNYSALFSSFVER